MTSRNAVQSDTLTMPTAHSNSNSPQDVALFETRTCHSPETEDEDGAISDQDYNGTEPEVDTTARDNGRGEGETMQTGAAPNVSAIKRSCSPLSCDDTFRAVRRVGTPGGTTVLDHVGGISTGVDSCRLCDKTFANVYRLQRHMLSHSDGAALRRFRCTECSKAFKFKHHLKVNYRIKVVFMDF